MDECWEESQEIRKEGNHWVEGRKEFIEEALNLASKDWLDLVIKKVGEEMVILGKRKGGNEGMYKVLYK